MSVSFYLYISPSFSQESIPSISVEVSYLSVTYSHPSTNIRVHLFFLMHHTPRGQRESNRAKCPRHEPLSRARQVSMQDYPRALPHCLKGTARQPQIPQQLAIAQPGPTGPALENHGLPKLSIQEAHCAFVLQRRWSTSQGRRPMERPE